MLVQTCPKCDQRGPAADFTTMFGENECPACGHLFVADPSAEHEDDTDE
jgi:transposase